MQNNIEFAPIKFLKEMSEIFPRAYKRGRDFREAKGKSLPDWPDWCYLPIAAGYAIATEGASTSEEATTMLMETNPLYPGWIVAAITWRITKGIYRFDPEIYQELVTQEFDGTVRTEHFKRLPEWCIYIETPGMLFYEKPITGVMVHLEHDMNDQYAELRLILFPETNESERINLSIHLGDWDIATAISKSMDTSKKNLGVFKDQDLFDSIMEKMQSTTQYLIDFCKPVLNLVLYLCSDNADMPSKISDHIKTNDKKPAKKQREVAANEIQIVNVGIRIGTAIRKFRNMQAAEIKQPDYVKSSHENVQPHIRRAHWHSFWTGPKKEPSGRQPVLHWLPPIPVGIEFGDELDAVIRPVK